MRRPQDQHPRLRRGSGRLKAAESVRQDVTLAERELAAGLIARDAGEVRARIHNARRFLSEAIEKLRRMT